MQAVHRALRLFDWRHLAVAAGKCPICGPTLLVRLQNSAIGVRCMRCRGSAIHLSIATVLEKVLPRWSSPSVYELSARGSLLKLFNRSSIHLSCSEYFDGVPPGTWVDGVQCQDVQGLTYADATFDLCTSTEVFEHVPDDRKGFAEIHRVLKPGGCFVFTVPLSQEPRTVERAKLVNGEVVHILEPVYHGDRQRGYQGVLAYRDYGRDIIDRLLEAGFSKAMIVPPPSGVLWGLGSEVVVAEKDA